MTGPADKLPVVLAVGGVIYRVDDRGRLVILLIKKRGGYWTLPKGKLIPGEEESAALAREVTEETGLEGTIGQPIRSVSYKIVKQGQVLRKQVNYYLVLVTASTLRLNADEQIIKAGWFLPNTALRRLKRGRLRVILRQAWAMINS